MDLRPVEGLEVVPDVENFLFRFIKSRWLSVLGIGPVALLGALEAPLPRTAEDNGQKHDVRLAADDCIEPLPLEGPTQVDVEQSGNAGGDEVLLEAE